MPINSVLKNIGFLGILFLASIVFTQCGQRGTPNGGAKDIIPPKVKGSSPQNFSTNFTGKKITLQFDEYVQVKSFQKEFLISPPVKSPPTYKLSGKKLVIKFDSSFAENTTYTMFLGKSVVDLNESNPLDSNLFVFSTGDVLDSLEYEGQLLDAFSGKPEDDILVHLYQNLSDTAPITTLPSYFAVAKKGQFKFKNLAAGTYRIFALQDANNNYKYDLPNEKIGFLNELITIPADSSKTILYNFLPEKTKQIILKPYSEIGQIVIVPFNIPAKDYTLQYLSDSLSADSIVEYWNTNHDTLYLYSKQFKSGNRYQITVQTDTLPVDTFNVKISKHNNKLEAAPNFSTRFANNYTNSLKLQFNNPLANFCDSCFYLFTETDSLQLKNISLESTRTVLSFQHSFAPALDYQLQILPNAFTSVLGETNDTLTYEFPMEEEGNYGNLQFSWNFKETEPYIFQLFSGKKIVAEFTSNGKKGKHLFEGLKAGNFKLKVTVDSNNDGRWTPGNYHEKLQSEKVSFYEKPIQIRKNWDLEVIWVVE